MKEVSNFETHLHIELKRCILRPVYDDTPVTGIGIGSG